MRKGQRVAVAVWLCHECGSYYASSSVGNLAKQWNKDKKGNPTFPRSRCPTPACAAAGRERVRHIVNV